MSSKVWSLLYGVVEGGMIILQLKEEASKFPEIANTLDSSLIGRTHEALSVSSHVSINTMGDPNLRCQSEGNAEDVSWYLHQWLGDRFASYSLHRLFSLLGDFRLGG